MTKILPLLALCFLPFRGYAQSIPDPVALIQGVEMARLKAPPARFYFQITFSDPLRKNQNSHVMEFDGEKRRVVALSSNDPSLFYDGSQAGLYLPNIQQASLRDLEPIS